MSAPILARVERFGAWARTDERTLVAIDRDTTRSLGLDGGELWDEATLGDVRERLTAPLELHVAVTSRCPASCEGCYLDARADGDHVALESLERTLTAASEAGVFTVAFGGGEPLSHPALAVIAEKARALDLVPVVTTSGIGLTAERARALRSFAQVNVSHDGVGDAYRAVRGFDGTHVAERAIALLVEAGVAVGVNLVLTRDNFDAIEDTCARVADLGAREVQLLRYKPAGRAASLEYLTKRLSRDQVGALPRVVKRMIDSNRIGVRIDCALVALLSPAFDDPKKLEALGVMGCEAGNALSAVNVRGKIAPCSFAPETRHSPEEILMRFDDEGTELDAFRDYSKSAPEPCASCPVRAVCKGGCRIVAGHLGKTPFAPDPECPRVIAHREGARV